ncbi:hypothetical protein Y032_0003g1259 [Ancylostoma ceylanicum]|uniref:Uncharacterized protein n=1 Tax=Ancylostoma ceylanicum TaxID=53326 RepID=A0A016VWM9_9BILA|nr:hypothetical protein Y032_0003g1259 [Ancylostoma ceylanicum]
MSCLVARLPPRYDFEQCAHYLRCKLTVCATTLFCGTVVTFARLPCKDSFEPTSYTGSVSSCQGARAFPRLPFLDYGSSQDCACPRVTFPRGSRINTVRAFHWVHTSHSTLVTLFTLFTLFATIVYSAQPQWPNGPADEDAVLPSTRMSYSPSSSPPEFHVEPP